MRQVNIDIYGSLGLSVIIVLIGNFLTSHIKVLQKYSIPPSVVGGFLFAFTHMILRQMNVCEINVDMTLREIFMVGFFCTVGFSASFIKIKKNIKTIVLLVILSTVLVICQNIIGVYISKSFNINPLLGLCLGSASMVGGHDTGGSIAPIFENVYGVTGANAVTMAAATFGLVAGGLVGGPIGIYHIQKNKLKPKSKISIKDFFINQKKYKTIIDEKIIKATMLVMFSLGFGTIVYALLSKKMVVPIQLGAMLVGIIIRNIADIKKIKLPMEEMDVVSDICLKMFLGLGMIDLKLWQLIDLAIPMITILLVQVVFMVLYALFVVFNVMGRNYDAALMSAGMCGFGLGATPNAIANMKTIAEKKGMSVIPFLVIPIIGGVIMDFINIVIISGFATFLRK